MESKEELELELLKAKLERAQVDIFIQKKRDKREESTARNQLALELIRTVMFVLALWLIASVLSHA